MSSTRGWRHNENVAILPSAERAASGDVDSADFHNWNARGMHLVIAATAVQNTNEVQHITVDAEGGTFTVTFDGQTTPAQAFNVAAATLQTALRALSSIGAGNVTVTGGPGDAGGTEPYVVTFIGDLGRIDVEAMTTNAASLTGGAGTADVTTDTEGGADLTPSVVFKVQGKDPATGTYYDILTSAAVVAIGTTVLKIYPGITVAANVSVSDVLPQVWRVKATHGDTDGLTYSVSANLVL